MKNCLCPVVFFLNLLTTYCATLYKDDVIDNTWKQPTVDRHNTSFLHGVDRRDVQNVDGQCKYAISGQDEGIHTADRQFVRNFQIKTLARERNISFLEDDLVLQSSSDSFELLSGHPFLLYNMNSYPLFPVELQWLEHLKNQENLIETGVVRANECFSSRQTPKMEPKPSLSIIDVDFGTSYPDSRTVTVVSISIGRCSTLACIITNTEASDQFIMHRHNDRHILIVTRVVKDSCNAAYSFSAVCNWQDKFSPFRTYSSQDSYVVRFAGTFCSTTTQSKLLPSVHTTPTESTDIQTSTETSMAGNLFTTKITPSAKVQQNNTAKQNTVFTDHATQRYTSHLLSVRPISTEAVIIVQSARISPIRTISISETNLSEIKLTPTHLKESGKSACMTEWSDTSRETSSVESTPKRKRLPINATNEPITTLHTPILYFNTDTQPSKTARHKTAAPKNIITQREATLKNIFETSIKIVNTNTGITNYGNQGYIRNSPRVMHRSILTTITYQPTIIFRNITAPVTKSNLLEISLTPTLSKTSDKPGNKTERSVTTVKRNQFVYSAAVSSHETASVETTLVRERVSANETKGSESTTSKLTLILRPSLAIHKSSSPKVTSMQQEAIIENSFEKSTKIPVITAVVCVILGVSHLVGLYCLILKE